jgi:hypothetical protein
MEGNRDTKGNQAGQSRWHRRACDRQLRCRKSGAELPEILHRSAEYSADTFTRAEAEVTRAEGS